VTLLAKKDKNVGVELAARQIARWDDETLMGKTADDVVKSFGVMLSTADRLLQREIKARKFRKGYT